jgi:N-succinyldiaminopimelate aminotransferase
MTPSAGRLSTRRLAGFGPTIFAEMSARAQESGAINLGQGFPDVSGPDSLIESAAAAMRAGHNQYPPVPGLPQLRAAISRHQLRHYGLTVDPQSEVVVTAGASEAIAAALIMLTGPGDEVIVLEPYYDLYAAAISMAGASLVPVRLAAPDYAFRLDALEAAVTPRSRLLLLNSPHNPTGTVLTRSQLESIATLTQRHDLLVITDDVYEHLTFDGVAHVSLAVLEGMAERTLSISSAGKSLSVTGWKIGWATGPADLVAAVATAKQYLSFAAGTPFQHAVAAALDEPRPFWERLAPDLQRRRDLLAEGLISAGMSVNHPQGTYFLIADISAITGQDALAFCRRLPVTCGVAAIPTQVFYDDPSDALSYVRFTFCKRDDVLRDAVRRLVTRIGTATR